MITAVAVVAAALADHLMVEFLYDRGILVEFYAF